MLRKAASIACPTTVTNPDSMTAAQLLAACPTITSGTNNNYASGNYFEIASENLLGTKQHYQFQPSNIYGTVTEGGEQVTYHWESKCTAVGLENCDSSTEPTVNSLSEMPRSYHEGNDSLGDYYTWYAATAEAGKYNTVSANVKDSICPSGWQLPNDGDSSTDKSFRYLVTNYGLPADAVSQQYSTTLRKAPLSMTIPGDYAPTTGQISNRYHGTYASNTPYATHWLSAANNTVSGAKGFVIAGATNQYVFNWDVPKSYGTSILCIRRSEPNS